MLMMPVAIILVLASAAGCSKQQPQLMCAAPAVLQALQSSFFSGADRRIDANAAENPMVDWVAMKRELQLLKADNLFSISEIVLKEHDKETKATRCRAAVRIALPEKYGRKLLYRLPAKCGTQRLPRTCSAISRGCRLSIVSSPTSRERAM